MDQPYTKENIETAMKHVRKLLEGVNALERLFPGRHFTLDGHLVGSVGEVAAAYHYGVELFPPSTELHDGFVGSRNVQIKITQTDYVLIGEKPDFLIVLYLAKTGNIYVVDELLMDRHMARVARRKSKNHLKGPAKRTEEDNRRFEERFRRLIETRGAES